MSASLNRLVDEMLANAFSACGLPTETARATRSTLPELADLQCNGAMPLAKSLKRNPRELAAEVAEKLKDQPAFKEVSVAGPGFLNLRLSDEFLSECAAAQAASPDLGIVQLPADTVVLDYGGPNVAKPLHVGHLRALVIGESLRRINAAQGLNTVSDIHLGDWGLQMGQLISEIRLRWPELGPGETPDLTMDDLQRLYPEAAAACKADPARMELARAATAALQAGDPDATAIWQKLRDISLTAQRLDIDLLDTHFDLFLGESDVQPLIPGMIADMRAKGVAVESDGALIVDVATPGDNKPMPPLLLQKKDGAALYATTDLATIVARVRDQDPKRIVYVVDQRQELHFRQVFKAAERGDLAPGVELIHAGFGTVNGADGKPYKTRDGGVALLKDLIGEAIEKAGERLVNDDLTLDRIELAKLVGVAALKFADLSSYRISGYIYDADRMVSFEGKTGPYVQYACVRIGSILANAEAKGYQAGALQVTAPAERALVLECARLPEVVASAGRNNAPNEVADYVFSVAQAFSRFYTDCPVLAADTEAERASRLALCGLARAVLAKGLWLLGIAVPERM
ncbi:arginine--tRNA ligase [Labrys okinawensis]|uniref:Arginine--tRNA ligase n=1 Tax=Labrys okinawensis TaxID=346911 RepID=A0A2S9QGF4_9HYPH|nr:arginine--tRNA ligase [Labrys okinawensis]PRH88437.1 arginine--tRNA ligase [Labrys okinawensis]